MTREEAITQLELTKKAFICNYADEYISEALDIAIKALEQQKIGKWIDDADKIDTQFGRHTYKCSECGKYAEYFVSGTEVWWDRIKPNFCPNCGAKMIKEDNI